MSKTGGKGESERWCVVVAVWLEKTAEAMVVRTSDAEVVMEMEADACDGMGGVGAQDDDGGRWWEGVDVVKKK
ncbi:hypothetical protein HanIR_Chr11g0524481 [Helianthus annuus]|nr:hypothetical protein HanIR_Chr11g0524481 [Helianthus annuus]